MIKGAGRWFFLTSAGSIDINIIIVIMGVCLLILLILTIVMIANLSRLKKRIDRFTSGSDGKSLEQDIISIIEDHKFLRINEEQNNKQIQEISERQKNCFQKMGLVKYDAFHQMGGQLSFSLCLLDENDNGFIINSVHSTEGCYSYTKEVKEGVCSLDLGDEEAEALEIALSRTEINKI